MDRDTRYDDSPCWCDGAPTFDPDYEFDDGNGYECAVCGANVFRELVAR